MSALPKQETYYTVEEYLALELASDTRWEYFDGEIVDMAGGSISHSRISGNVYFALKSKLTGSRCEALNSEMCVKVPAAPPYRYPDASVVCGQIEIEELQGIEMLLNPVLLVEVLSPTTANYDRDKKFLAYQSIPSFQEYLLVEQDRVHVTHYVRQSDGAWLRRDVIGIEATVKLASVNCELTMTEIYRDVTLAVEVTEPSN